VTLRKSFVVAFAAPPGPGVRHIQVVLCHSGFSTHGANHGMRNVNATQQQRGSHLGMPQETVSWKSLVLLIAPSHGNGM